MAPNAEPDRLDGGPTPLHLTGTRVAEYFRFACDRQLRYELVPAALRGGDVPRAGVDEERGVRIGPRPGTGLLAAAGRRWERERIRKVIRRLGAARVLHGERTPDGGFGRVDAERVVRTLRDPGPIEVIVQPELRLPDPAAFARRFGLDPERVRFGTAVPDLLRIRRLPSGRTLYQVVDIKASAAGRVPHFAQVAYYSLVLDEICAAGEAWPGRPDHRWGRVWARDGRGPARFPLAAYRHHVAEMLSRDLARAAGEAPAEAAWHVGPRCAGCVYLEHCRAQADERDDLARVPGVTPGAKRVLRERGIDTVDALVRGSHRRGAFDGCHALESQADRIRQRAQAVRFGKVYDVEARTHLMPPDEDVRVILAAEGDPVTGTCFALGMRVDSHLRIEGAPPLGLWISDAGTRRGERAMLDAFLGALERLLGALDARNGAAGRRGGATLHFYLYDRADLEVLRDLLMRHVGEASARPGIARALRFLSPRTVSLRPEAVRSSPGTVVADVVAALFALPVPYAYDLAAVSARLRPSRGDWAHAPRPGFASAFSSQVAFERIHDVWGTRPGRRPDAAVSPDEVRAEIQRTLASKLKAVDSVVRAVRERAARRRRLQMRKEPFALRDDPDVLRDPDLETLRVFAELEAASDAVATRALHVLPSAERARRFESIRGMSLVERGDDGTLRFEFDPECRDAKFRPGDFNLVLTNDDESSLLETDHQPWKRRTLMVELVGYDLSVSPPQVVLAPGSGLAKAEESGWIDLDRLCVLDRASADFSTARLLATLRALDEGRGEAERILAIVRGTDPAPAPRDDDAVDAVEAALLAPAAARLGRPVLNPDQAHAWRAALGRGLSVVWGPPGTGKTYLLAWTLMGLAEAARREGRPCRMLVAASTHRAVVNVLARLDAEMRGAGIDLPLRAVKLRGSGSEADADLEGGAAEAVPDTRLPALLAEAEATGTALVVGSTVWSLWKRMRAATGGDPVDPTFDVVVIDEASQMKVPEALIALSSLRPGAQVVVCGDDRQLAPILHARYDTEAGTLFGSVFTHLAGHFPRLALRESRRMNRALVRYPRERFYPGLVSRVPERRIGLLPAPAEQAPEDALLRDLFLRPDDAVVFCTYRGVRATARNPFEAELVARLAVLARGALADPRTGGPYAPADFAGEAFAILSPHRAQNSAILAGLQRAGMPEDAFPVVDTVERMQGNEREMIVVSYAVADREYAEAEAGFLLDPNRFNVSITRARAKLVVLVSEEVLDALSPDEEVLSGSIALKGYRAHCSDRVREAELAGPDGAAVRVRCHYRVLGEADGAETVDSGSGNR